MGPKFCRNGSISHRFRDKCILVFNSEIADSPQKGRENVFWGMLSIDFADTPWVKIFVKVSLSHIFIEKCVFVFDAEIQDSGQKWRENNFCTYLVGQKFHQNRSILHQFQDKCIFTYFIRNSRSSPKMTGKQCWGKVTSRLFTSPQFKIFVEIYYSITHHFQYKCVFAFSIEIQDGHQ